MPGDVEVKDNANTVHQINTDVLADGGETQVVKVQMGDAGSDGGYVSRSNPLPIEMAGFFKRLFLVFGRFSFDTTSALRTSGSVSVSSGTVTTVGTMTTGNIGIGDWGKLATAMEQSHLAFQSGIRRNFTKA